MLYEAETKDLSPTQLLAELPVAPEEYASQLVMGVERRGEEVNRLLGRHATGWTIERMPVVDRCVLRMAAYELLDELGEPASLVATVQIVELAWPKRTSLSDMLPPVVLDEAVELAKTYSTEDSGRYVNGVLSAVATEVRPDERQSGGAPFRVSLE